MRCDSLEPLFYHNYITMHSAKQNNVFIVVLFQASFYIESTHCGYSMVTSKKRWPYKLDVNNGHVKVSLYKILNGNQNVSYQINFYINVFVDVWMRLVK